MCRWMCYFLALGLLVEGRASARSSFLMLAQQEQTEPKPLVWPKKGTKPKPKPPAQKPGATGKKNPPRKIPGKGKPVPPGKTGKETKESPPPPEPSTQGNSTEKGSEGKAAEEPSELGAVPSQASPAIPSSTSPTTNEPPTNKDSSKEGVTTGKEKAPATATDQPASKDQDLTTGNEPKASTDAHSPNDTKNTGEPAVVLGTPSQPNTTPVQSEPLFKMSLTGGVLLLRSMRIDPSVMLMCDFDVGRFLGWHGLYVGLEADSYMGTSLFGTSYLMFDGLLGFRGRFGWPTIKILAGLGAGIRYMVLLGKTTGTSESPEIGFGGEATAGVEYDLTSWMFVVVRASGRYMKEPLAPRFQFSSVFGAGVGFSF
jgi:hypothetical protein